METIALKKEFTTHFPRGMLPSKKLRKELIVLKTIYKHIKICFSSILGFECKT
jgi:hypothetical protein